MSRINVSAPVVRKECIMFKSRNSITVSAVLILLLFSPVAADAFGIQPVVAGLAQPVAISHANDGSGRLFIVQQPGRIVVYTGSQVLAAPFLDIQSLVSCCGEQGLLGLAFHPRYRENGFFYVYYADTAGSIVVARYRVSDDPNVADPGSAAILLTIPHPFYANHNGGQLQFGPDGYLYIGVGDGGAAGDPFNNAQNLQTLLGKILRIDVDSLFPYAVPATNPFAGRDDARGEIWALGLRNPWRFSFDSGNGDLFIADVGQNNWEEVNHERAMGSGGANYGWRLMEGGHCYDPPSDCNTGNLTLPILEYGHSLGCSVTGGYVYRGTLVTDLFGVYLYADFCSGRIWGASMDPGGAWATNELVNTGLNISTFGVDQSGEVYFAHHSPDAGVVYKIVP